MPTMNAVEEIRPATQLLTFDMRNKPRPKKMAVTVMHHARPEPVIESADENAEEAGDDEGHGMSACQGGSGPAKVGKERLEKDTESDMGANPCRLDCKAGGYNEIAIK